MSGRESTADGGRLRFAVVDAQPLFRAGVIQALKTWRLCGSCVEGHCAADALHLAETQPIDIMVVDLDVPGGGAEAVATIGRLWPAVRLVILTRSEQPEDVTGALGCGARGYVLKTAEAGELLTALRLVASGETYVAPSLGARLFARSQTKTASQPTSATATSLTPREDEILGHVSLGATNKEIARQLKISEKTVKYFMTNIMQKLQVRNRVEAVVVARKRAVGE